MTRLSGRVPETGTAISGVTVAIIDTQGTEDPTQWSIVASTTTDANGEWSVSGLAPSAVERYHAVAQYDSGTEFVNFESLPYLSTPADAFAPTTSINVGTPTASVSVGSAIPDSLLSQYDATEESGTGSITEINDQLGFANLGGGAEVISSGINGLQTYRFDGSSDSEMLHTTTYATGDPFAIIMVAQQQEASDSNNGYCDGGAGFEFAFQDNNNSEYRGYRGGAGTGTDFGSATVDQNPHIFVIEGLDGNEIRAEKDGTDLGTLTLNSSDLTGLKLAGFADRSDLNMEVDIGQVEVTQGHSSSDLDDIKSRLADKWGITI